MDYFFRTVFERKIGDINRYLNAFHDEIQCLPFFEQYAAFCERFLFKRHIAFAVNRSFLIW